MEASHIGVRSRPVRSNLHHVGFCGEVATGYLWTVVTANRCRLAELEGPLTQDTRHVLARKTRVHIECVTLPGSESLAYSSNCEVCWDGR